MPPAVLGAEVESAPCVVARGPGSTADQFQGQNDLGSAVIPAKGRAGSPRDLYIGSARQASSHPAALKATAQGHPHLFSRRVEVFVGLRDEILRPVMMAAVAGQVIVGVA